MTDSKKDSGVSIKGKNLFKTPETVEGFCFVISVTGLCRPNAGKGDGDVLVV
jgi:hypothetical protein